MDSDNKLEVVITPTIEEKLDKSFLSGLSQEDVETLTIQSTELNSAMNKYRASHGVPEVKINQELCNYALKRAQDMKDLNIGKDFGDLIMNHDKIDQELKSSQIKQYIHGKTKYGENIGAAVCQLSDDPSNTIKIMTASDLTDRCFDSSPTHKTVLLDARYRDGCSVGIFPFYVQIFSD